ncbi:Dihydrofolate reductase type 3 [Usitatibacter rugosus]|uniref:Dihydrofolate reductase n=1 Tax=Usitatibacter rugosus TaxID=2732067 RepID=A0A6M4GST5_9PROT|nr:dihydrofolate reductase [Usitatibacter rugosus]QJR10311.1 Dihydrofolate reductase type 3 [Usitatibacter rugosus]
MIRSYVVAATRNRVIGKGNGMPWHLPSDLAFFKKITMGHPIVMGRKTHESIGKALPGRTNIVITRDPAFKAPGCVVVDSLEAAYRAAGDVDEVFVIGGAQIFEAGMPGVDRIYLTDIDAQIEGDTWFPPFDRSQWVETELARQGVDERHAFATRTVRLDRKRPA